MARSAFCNQLDFVSLSRFVRAGAGNLSTLLPRCSLSAGAGAMASSACVAALKDCRLPCASPLPDQRACSFDGKVFAARRRHHIIKITRDHEIAHVFGPKQSDRSRSFARHKVSWLSHGLGPALG
jgi:hypothetical protein